MFVCFRTATVPDFHERCIGLLAGKNLHFGIKLGENASSYEAVFWPGYKSVSSSIGDKIATKQLCQSVCSYSDCYHRRFNKHIKE